MKPRLAVLLALSLAGGCGSGKPEAPGGRAPSAPPSGVTWIWLRIG